MTKKLRQVFLPGTIVHLHRLLFFAVGLVLAIAVAPSARFEVSSAKDEKNSTNAVIGSAKVEHRRAGTSPAPTNSTGAEKSCAPPARCGRDARDPSGKVTYLTETDTNATGKSRFATLDGARVHYVNYGKGSEALLLIHGWTCNVNNWRDQIPDFTKRNRVIAIDLPGHGQSDKPQLTYRMDFFARAVDAVLRDAKVKRAVLVGHSMGTPIARQFYRKYPEKALAIVIVDGPLRPFGDKATMDNMIAGFRGPTYLDAVTKMFAAMTPNLAAEAKERIKASLLNTPQQVLVSAMEGMADPSIWGEDKINVPVMAIMAKSPFFGADLEQRYRSIAPNMEFQMWDGVGHFIMMEKPKEFNDAVLAFLDKNKLLKK